MARFIVIVLDSFGVGSMSDCPEVRIADVGANTALHILQSNPNYRWPTLEKLGLMNILETTINGMKPNPEANFGIANLTHFGADSFAGHQEIMGTAAKEPVLLAIQEVKTTIANELCNNNYQIKMFEKNGLEVILVNDAVIIADNMETDLGQVINVSGLLDEVSFTQIMQIGRIVRSVVKVSRVITLGGRNVSLEKMLSAIYTKGRFIGLDTPLSGLYLHDYHVVHLGYGVDEIVQVPHQLALKNIETIFVGKVGDIVANPSNNSVLGVDSEYLFDAFRKEIKKQDTGFFCLNIQETDLAGHAENTELYAQKIELADQKISEIIQLLGREDILIVMADHGNDPTIGHSQHTREKVPLLVYKKGIKGKHLGERKTMADVGATVAEFFGTEITYGTSFFKKIIT